MAQRKMRCEALFGRPGPRRAGQRVVRRAAFTPQHGDLGERKAAQPHAAGFQECFLGGEVGGGGLPAGLAAARGEQRLLLRRKNAVQKRLALQAALHAGGLAQVGPDAKDSGCFSAHR